MCNADAFVDCFRNCVEIESDILKGVCYLTCYAKIRCWMLLWYIWSQGISSVFIGIIILFVWEVFSPPALADGFFLEFEWQHVSSSL